MNTKLNRRQQILEAFAFMLESQPGSRITTAALAKQVGVSEAALYRHFPSKAKMIDGLIEFIEESLFTRINRITKDAKEARTEGQTEGQASAAEQCRAILWLLLTFAERNPGFARLMVGDALQGETERLRTRMRQVFDRLETHLRQIVRDHYAELATLPGLSTALTANLLLSAAEGRINQFVRSDFKSLPTSGWNDQWGRLAAAVF